MTRDEARNIFDGLRIGQIVVFVNNISPARKKIITAIKKCERYGTCDGTTIEHRRICNGNRIGFDGSYPECISASKTKRKCNIAEIIEDFIEEDEFMI